MSAPSKSERNISTANAATAHKVVSERVWLAQRKELLIKEKIFTRQRDKLSRQRHALPWVKVEKPYVFDTPHGKAALADLFDGRSQLVVYHFMFGPDWKEGCEACSFLADHNYLDLAPLGRNERKGEGMDWMRLHDRYRDTAIANPRRAS